ncbi:MAG TPA: RNA polymerase sigma factor [Cytophagales bacterium]|nr:RNA polymerase sigma factor [Cytophagales bacterium]
MLYNVMSSTSISTPKMEEKHAFEELYDKYSTILLGIAFKITKNQQLAEDVIQESFIKIWKNISSFDSQKSTLFTWMLNITRNTAIDIIRKKSYSHSIQLDAQTLGMLDLQSNNNMNVNIIGVKELINVLKPELREVIDVVYFGGLTHEEASEQLDLPLGTIKTRVRNALKVLKNMYGNDWPLQYN